MKPLRRSISKQAALLCGVLALVLAACENDVPTPPAVVPIVVPPDEPMTVPPDEPPPQDRTVLDILLSARPTKLTAQQPEGGQTMMLNWAAPVAATSVASYKVERYTGSERALADIDPSTLAWVDITTSDDDATDTSFTDSPPAAGRYYFYRVSAVDDAGNDAASEPIVRKLIGLPAAVNKPTANRGNESAALSWTAPAPTDPSSALPDEIIDYAAQYRVVDADDDDDNDWMNADPATWEYTSMNIRGLVNGTAYQFRVSANSLAGSGPWSEPSDEVTPRAINTSDSVNVIAKPTNVTTTYLPERLAIKLTWSAVGAADGYSIERAASDKSPDALRAELAELRKTNPDRVFPDDLHPSKYIEIVSPGNAISGNLFYDDGALVDEKWYFYRIVARSKIKPDKFFRKSERTFEGARFDLPQLTSAPRSIAGDGFAVLSWTLLAEVFTGASLDITYEIEQRTATTQENLETATWTSLGTHEPPATFQGLTNGHFYQYRIRAGIVRVGVARDKAHTQWSDVSTAVVPAVDAAIPIESEDCKASRFSKCTAEGSVVEGNNAYTVVGSFDGPNDEDWWHLNLATDVLHAIFFSTAENVQQISVVSSTTQTTMFDYTKGTTDISTKLYSDSAHYSHWLKVRGDQLTDAEGYLISIVQLDKCASGFQTVEQWLASRGDATASHWHYESLCTLEIGSTDEVKGTDGYFEDDSNVYRKVLYQYVPLNFSADFDVYYVHLQPDTRYRFTVRFDPDSTISTDRQKNIGASLHAHRDNRVTYRSGRTVILANAVVRQPYSGPVRQFEYLTPAMDSDYPDGNYSLHVWVNAGRNSEHQGSGPYTIEVIELPELP